MCLFVSLCQPLQIPWANEDDGDADNNRNKDNHNKENFNKDNQNKDNKEKDNICFTLRS